MIKKPAYKFEEYESKGKVKIKNPRQAHKSAAHGARVYDNYPDVDCWVWVFSEEETAGLFDAWCKRELK
jgi:hypothetical protein